MSEILFFLFSFLTVGSSLMVLVSKNPLVSALFLISTMLGAAGLFFQLNAHFIAGVQLIVYAGAVVVLFLMVLMLFNLKNYETVFVSLRTFFSQLFLMLLLGVLIMSSLIFSNNLVLSAKSKPLGNITEDIKELSFLVFTDYILVFEVLGILLLVVAIGAVCLVRQQKEEESVED